MRIAHITRLVENDLDGDIAFGVRLFRKRAVYRGSTFVNSFGSLI